jgi:uncharacterized phiE125 gp8 family phage protein
MALTRVIAPTDEPLTLDEVREHLRIVGTDQDNYLARLIAAARSRAERITKRALITQTWRVTLDEFPEWFDIPKAPLQSVLTINYLDGDGATVALYDSSSPQVGIADFVIDTQSDPARVLLAYGITWPAPVVQANAVSLTFEAGYGDHAEDVPEDLRLAMLLMIGHWFEHRESVAGSDAGGGTDLKDVPQSSMWILEDYRVLTVV